MSEPALALRDVTFTYPDGHPVLQGVTVAVDPGERVAVLGPNGAGKTTLALQLVGILEPHSGSVSVEGLPLGEEHLAEIRRRVGIVFQNADDQLFMPTVADDVGFGPANLGLEGDERTERVAEALRSVGAEDLGPRSPHHLSDGEKRRVALATVLAMRPSVLVLDEPTSGLDPAGRRELVDLLQALPMTQLVVTHDLPFALELCPRSIVLGDGRVVADGVTAEVLADTELLRANRLELPFGFDPDILQL